MLSLEQGVQHTTSESFAGLYRVSSLGVLTDYCVLPALLELRDRQPQTIFRMTTHLASEANRLLASGLIDVAFYYDATALEGIVCRRVGALANSLYCGRGHPLFGRDSVSARDLQRYEFSVASIGDHGTPMDSWPVDRPRRIGFEIMMLSTNLSVSLSGRFVTVLPDTVAEPHVAAGRLFRLAPELVPDTEVFAACRAEDLAHSVANAVIQAVERRISAAPRLREDGPRKPRGRKVSKK
jgi:DNA-binding transcriptional LysR family regulator